ncbi:hypothetical protein E3N88_23792 [Mikania micrantha]|uniref:Integrase catalytic domain-containing protein n=1 Tax=Mikania micrantha TaxID=192012 RepID=A0A5N6NE96_9ASTR|nr:hypothetical protein E3N88_23792 [Mikania micrantha]
MITKSLVIRLPEVHVDKSVICSGCQFRKSHQSPYHASNYKSTYPLELVHTDVFRLVKQPSVRGMRYMITFIDLSRYVWVMFMKEKSKALEKFKEFKVEAEKVTGLAVKILQSDNEGEYVSKEFLEYLNKFKIKRQLTCPNTPQQNGVSERKNRHLSEVSWSMLHDNVLGKFWAEAMHNATFVVNRRIPQQNLDYKSPYEKLFKVKPNVSYFRVFGSVCYVFMPSSQRHKLEKNVVRSIFVGYDSERKGWSNKVCLPLSGNETIIEDEFDQEQNNEPWQTGVFQQPQAQHEELRRSTRIRKPNPKYAAANLVEPMEEENEPESFEEVNSSAAWRAAMKHEIDALLQNETWALVPKPQ